MKNTWSSKIASGSPTMMSCIHKIVRRQNCIIRVSQNKYGSAFEILKKIHRFIQAFSIYHVSAVCLHSPKNLPLVHDVDQHHVFFVQLQYHLPSYEFHPINLKENIFIFEKINDKVHNEYIFGENIIKQFQKLTIHLDLKIFVS